jgi:hypothetical protein
VGEGDHVTDQKIQTGLELNRAFYEGRGDDFVNIIVECVENGAIAISEASAKRLLDAVTIAVRPSVAE